MKLKEICLKNWKSFEDGILYLDPLTMLIGKNCSGKTNCYESLSFLSTVLNDGIEKALTSIRGSIEGLFLDISKPICLSILITKDEFIDYKYEICFKYNVSKKSIELCKERIYISELLKDCQDNLFCEIDYLENNNLPGFNLRFYCDEGKNILFDKYIYLTDTYEIATKYIPISYFIIVKDGIELYSKFNELTIFIYDSIKDIYWFDYSVRSIIESSTVSTELKKDCSNIKGYLGTISKDKISIINTYLSQLSEQPFKELRIDVLNNIVDISIIEVIDGNDITVNSDIMSKGTLYFISLLTIVICVPDHSYLILDDVERNLHPSKMELLMKLFKLEAITRGVSIIFTTNNTYLIDLMPTNLMEYIQVCYRHPTKKYSLLNSIGNLDSYTHLISSGSLGSLCQKGKIEEYFQREILEDELKNN